MRGCVDLRLSVTFELECPSIAPEIGGSQLQYIFPGRMTGVGGEREDDDHQGERERRNTDRRRLCSSRSRMTISFSFGGGSRRIFDTRTSPDARLTDCFPVLSGRAMASQANANGLFSG